MNHDTPTIHPLTAIGGMLGMLGGITWQQVLAVLGQALVFLGVYLDWRMSRRLKAQREELLAIEARLKLERAACGRRTEAS